MNLGLVFQQGDENSDFCILIIGGHEHCHVEHHHLARLPFD